MNRIILLLLTALCIGSDALAEPTRPNIVFFFSDDLGYADLACYGHPYAKTPSLDQLAKEGTRFEQHYVTGVTCNPSRTGLMTGLFPARFQKYAADFGFGDRVSITELLKEAGYTTGHFGKWHIGPKSSEVAGTYGLDVVEIIGKSQGKSAGRDDDLTTAAIEFMKENAGGQPFYINIWGHSTHYPVYAADSKAEVFEDVTVNREDFSESMQEKFDQSMEIDEDLDQSMRQYLGDVYSVDENVGRVLKAIDELGIRENTIFVYSSDHGPAPVALGKKGVRDFSKNMLGYAGQLRGGKHNQLEGGTRVPFIVRWPGKVKAGRVESESATSFIDWMPTLAAIAGIENLPEEMDGEDVSDIWFGATRERTVSLFWKTSSSNAVVTIRDGKWKMHEAGRRKEAAQLYDLSVDPEERHNLVDELPEVAAKLQTSIDEWKSQLPSSYLKSDGKKQDR